MRAQQQLSGSSKKIQQQQQQQQQQAKQNAAMSWQQQQQQGPQITPFVWLVVWVAMSTGFLVGFTNGDSTLFIAGFRQLFFPQLMYGLGNPQDRAAGLITARPFCTFHHREVQLYQALPCLTAAFGALASGWLSHRHGRKASIWSGCLCYIASKVLLMTAQEVVQAWVAQGVAGAACGLLVQAPMLEVLEVAPSHRRGALAACIVLGRAAGFLCASLLSFGLSLNDSWGWRLVPLFGVSPAVLVILLLCWLPETPSSLVQRGRLEEGRLALHRLRGFFTKTEQEFRDILAAAELGSQARTQWQALHVRERSLALFLGLGAASLVAAGGGPVLQALAFPVCYAIGYGRLKGQTMSLVLLSLGALVGGVVAVLAADSIGRRRTTVAFSGVIAFGCLVVAIIIKFVYLPGNVQLAAPWAWTLAASLTASNAAFVAGPGTQLYVYFFEIQPLPTRSLSTALIAAWLSLQDCAWTLSALPLLCAARGWGLFLLFAVLNAVIAVLARAFLLTATKNVPLELIDTLWKRHWWWSRFCVRSAASLSACPPELSPGQASLCRMVSLQHQHSSSRHGGVLGRESTAIGCGVPVGIVAAAAVWGSASGSDRRSNENEPPEDTSYVPGMFRALSAAPADRSRHGSSAGGAAAAAAAAAAPRQGGGTALLRVQQLQPGNSPVQPDPATPLSPSVPVVAPDQ